MPRKPRVPIVIREVEGFTRQADGSRTFTDDFTGEVKPVLTGEARKAAPNPLSGDEFARIRHEAKRRKAAELLERANVRIAPMAKTVSVDQYIKPVIPNQRPVATMKVKDKPDVVLYQPANPIRRGY